MMKWSGITLSRNSRRMPVSRGKMLRSAAGLREFAYSRKFDPKCSLLTEDLMTETDCMVAKYRS